ncbi:hypothetical protein CONPUDRAFT_109281 [Coniophora puteana RWD-64-598 SS2]|uniref:Protein HRI1 n=1 Tax=Coniophora puteana (strain RWD-64-598) TaxID=741705 RepID=A0A5M3MFE4_CONPW|nr:uncharacterized protein CONPUDRAFT_109281 [Coniophora puteana RWD-64-598 SS2]EIW77968.1 hypothetical protein CONPUDRAFT_109281 [Coniophora puteana RWD-64-598 SS2]
MGISSSKVDQLTSEGNHEPTISDVFAVRLLLSSSPASLPVEIIDVILDHGAYWPHSTVEVKEIDVVSGGDDVEDKVYLRTLPLAYPKTEGSHVASAGQYPIHRPPRGSNEEEYPRRGQHPCRRIVFELLSRDQGWSSDRAYHKTYAHSWTWFDVSVERASESDSGGVADQVEHGLHPKDTHLQRNVHAKREFTRHVIVWDWQDTVEEGSLEAMVANEQGRGWRSMDGQLVRSLECGDRLVLWMHARFGGWRCIAESAKVTVYWAV